MDSDLGRPKKATGSKQKTPVKPTEAAAEPAFKTPEEVAAKDDVLEESSPAAPSKGPKPSQSDGESGMAKLMGRLHLTWPLSTRGWLVVTGLLVIIVWAICYSLTHSGGLPNIVGLHAKKPETKVASTLTGLPVDPKVNQQPVTAIMVENSIWARPQSGLGEAGVVFEAIAEGGITRFLAIYQDTAPHNIGPVRSARPYYIGWALGFDAAYAHVGGSPEALKDIHRWHVKDLNEFFNAGAYHRISSREAPHNVYTSIKALNKLEKSKGYTTSKYSGFARKPYVRNYKKRAENVRHTAGARLASHIDFNISSQLYNVSYLYDPVSNTYRRSEGGSKHIDANGNRRIAPTVVIAMVMRYGLESDDHHSRYDIIGHGKAYIFQDGTVTVGTWTKKRRNEDQIKFTDGKGNVIQLEPGRTWLTALASNGEVRYKH